MARFLFRIRNGTLMALIAALVVLGASARAADEDKGVLADLISRALSTPTTSVSIGAVDGVLSSDASISDIVLSDRQGPWLKIDKVRLVWNRLALFSRRLEVDQLTIGHMQWLRRALPPETPPPDNSGPRSILPELPVKVIVKQFAVQDLSLGEPVIGVAARLEISGRATLGPPSEGLDLRLTSRRLDAEGAFSALLTYVPATDVLTLKVDSEEPAGGLFVHAVNLPGLPPAKLAFNGQGPLDNFKANLDFAAGQDLWAKGDVIVARVGAGRRLTLDLNSRLEGMAPAIVRPVFAGETTLKGDILFNDDSSIALPGGLHLVSSAARLDFEGGKSADHQLDLRVHAGAVPGSQSVGKLDFNASIGGPWTAPRLDASFDAERIRVAQGSLDHVAGSFHAAPTGALTDEKTRIPFDGEAAVSGLALSDPAWGQALGSAFRLSMRGSAAPSGQIAFDALDLSAPHFDAHYAGLLAVNRLHGKLTVAAGDLSRFARLAGGMLKGEAHIAADLDGAPRYGALSATLDAQMSGLATDYPILDRITGGNLVLKGAAQLTQGGGFGFSNLRATGDHGSAKIDGNFGRDKVDLSAAVDVPQAQAIDPRIVGPAHVAATLAGLPTDLDANLTATLSEGRLLDRPADLTVEARVNHVTGQLDATGSVSGTVDRHPLQGAVHVAKRSDGGWTVDDLGLSLASAHLEGSFALSNDRLADGDLMFSATNLDDLSPLVLTKMTGALSAKVSASSSGGRQALAIAADSARMSIGPNTLEGLKIDLSVGDLWGARNVSGQAKLSRAEFAGQSIADVKVTASGRADTSDLDVSGTVRGLAVKAHGRLTGGPPIRLDLTSLTADGGGRKLSLAGPATFTYADDGVEIRNFALALDGGRLSLSGRAGKTLDLRASASAVPLAALDLVSPNLGFAGVADGEATIGGAPADPTGDWRIRLKQVSTAQTRDATMPALDVTGSGRLAGGRTSLDINITAAGGNAVRVTGSAPLSSDGALDARIDGKLDVALANPTLSVSGRRAAGSLAIALELRGTVLKPQAQGSIRLTGGEFRDDQTGFRLSGIRGVFTANGGALRIDQLGGTTPNGGSIRTSGEVKLDPAAGFPGAIRVTGSRAELVANDIVSATADFALDISGRLDQKPNVAGRVTVESMDITVPNRFNSVSDPIPGTKHLNPTPTARARLGQLARTEAKRQGPPFDATLALDVFAANRILIRGRGINAEMSGEARVSGSARDPRVNGGFTLLRGSLSLLGRRLDFTRGKLDFHGDWMPELDLVAETTAADITARISVTGPASQPTFSITSTPSLPQDEILSRILFQRPSGSLSAFQALELANAVATLSGSGDALEPLRKSLGLNSLGVNSGSTGSALLGLSRALNDRLNLNVNTGATPQDNGVSLDLDVTRHIRLQAGVDASGGSSAGVGAEWEFK